MRKWIFWALALMIMATGCSDCGGDTLVEETDAIPAPQGDYLGETPPDLYPTLFGARIVCGHLFDRDITFAPSLKEFYYTITNVTSDYHAIMKVQKFGDKWGQPEVAEFSGRYSDMEPMITPDGREMYFVSNRPYRDSITDPIDWNIWRMSRQSDGSWSEPTPLDSNVNTINDEFYPSLAEDGSLYFTSIRENGIGGEDIFVSEPDGVGGFLKPTVLSGANTTHHEFNAFVAPDESYLIFSSAGRDDDMGRGDLYISYASDTGWTAAQNFGPFINSEKLDFSPSVTPDGEYMFFTSLRSGMQWHSPYADRDRNEIISMFQNIYNGQGNIFWVKVSNLPNLLNGSSGTATQVPDSTGVDSTAIDTTGTPTI